MIDATRPDDARPTVPESAVANPTAPRTGTRVIAVFSDVMASLQLEAPARAAGWSLETVPHPAALSPVLAARRPDVVVLDLADAAFSFAGVYRTVREEAPEARIVGFYPHVRRELGSMARDAGCDQVLPRSRFFMNPAAAVEAALAASAQPPA